MERPSRSGFRTTSVPPSRNNARALFQAPQGGLVTAGIGSTAGLRAMSTKQNSQDGNSPNVAGDASIVRPHVPTGPLVAAPFPGQNETGMKRATGRWIDRAWPGNRRQQGLIAGMRGPVEDLVA